MDPKGPLQTDFYRLLTGAQGTFGIVTWASVKCELLADPEEDALRDRAPSSTTWWISPTG